MAVREETDLQWSKAIGNQLEGHIRENTTPCSVIGGVGGVLEGLHGCVPTVVQSVLVAIN